MTNEHFRKELISCINRVKSEEANSKSSCAIKYDQYFKLKDYCQIKGLYYFVCNNKHMDCEEIEEMLVQNNKTFIFLSDFVIQSKDVLYRMEELGLKYACVTARNHLYAQAHRKVLKNKRKTATFSR